MTTVAKFGALASVVLLGACGGGGGSSTATPTRPVLPTPTPAPTATFFDGATEAPLQPEVTPAAPVLTQPMLVKAPGFLIREQNFTGAPIHLWPSDDAYVSELVYSWKFTDGSYRMVKYGGPLTLTLDGDLAQNDVVIAKAYEVLEEVQRVSGLQFTLGPGGAVVVSLNENILSGSNHVGEVRWTVRGPTIVGAQIVFASRGEITGGTGSAYRNTFHHEMGHVLGLGHSPSNRDIMAPGGVFTSGSRVGEYQEGEAIALRMMYRYRTAGNFPPDRDPALGLRPSEHVRPAVTVIRD